jgi:RNA polymerase sigma-70 factor, ECF subfamily
MFPPNRKDTSSEMACIRSFAPTGDESGADSSHADRQVLVREAQRGSLAAFDELVRQYHEAAFRLALRLTGSEPDAQDVCQEAFLSAYQNLASFRFECTFYTWIYRIVTNRCLDFLRRRRNHYEAVTPRLRGCVGSRESNVMDRVADGQHASNPESGLVTRELQAYISRALEKLSPCERRAFELKHYRGLKLRTVAAVLNTSEGNARHALFRARQKLRNALADLR